MDRASRNTKLYSTDRMDSVSAPRSRNTGSLQNGKLPALKAAHEGRLQAHAELSEALLGFYSGNVALAFRNADTLLSRVRAPELDLTGLTREEAHCVQHMPPEAWSSLQRFALLNNDTGITSVALSSALDIDSRLVDGLAQLHVQHLALGRRVSDTLMARLQALPCLEHLSQRDPPRATEYAALLQPTAEARETPSLRGPNRPPPTIRKMRGERGVRRNAQADDGRLQTGLNDAMKAGNGRAARYFAGAILRADLGPRLRLELLMAPVAPEWVKPAVVPSSKTALSLPPKKMFVPQLSAFVEDLAEGHPPEEAAQAASPLLGRICAEFVTATPGRAPSPQYEAIGEYLDEILNSDMPAQDKKTVCASIVSTPEGPRTAAQLAMQSGHPLAAASMLLAILECHVGPDEKLQMLATLGVGRAEVDAALSLPELQRIPLASAMKRLCKAGWDALALMADHARVTLKDAADAEPIVLRAERMWTKGSGLVLVSAEVEIPQLRFQQVVPYEHEEPEAEERHFYAVSPDWLVQKPAGTSVAQGNPEPPAL